MTRRTAATALTTIIVAGAVPLIPLAWPTAPATTACQTDTIALAGKPSTITVTACPTKG